MIQLTALMGFLLLSGATTMNASVAQAPDLPHYAVTLTAYNAVAGQTDENPLETASGAYSNPEIVAARSQDLADKLPFGTIIEIDGTDITQDNSCGYKTVSKEIGYRVIADTMNARYTNRIDVLLDNDANYTTTDKGMKNPAQMLGICKGASVHVVGHVNIGRMPKTQAELARIVRNGSTLALK